MGPVEPGPGLGLLAVLDRVDFLGVVDRVGELFDFAVEGVAGLGADAHGFGWERGSLGWVVEDGAERVAGLSPRFQEDVGIGEAERVLNREIDWAEYLFGLHIEIVRPFS